MHENADQLMQRGGSGGPVAMMYVTWREENFTDGQSTMQDVGTMAALEK
jgi:hypothetical protein